MSDAIFFGTVQLQIDEFNITNSLTKISELENYKNSIVVVEKLSVFGDVIDILNVKEKYLKSNNLSLYIYDQDILFSDWSDNQDFEMYAMISQFSDIDKDTLNNVCNKVASMNQDEWSEKVSFFKNLLN
jgi:hypothetical protein